MLDSQISQLAKEVWYAETEEEIAPCDVWWDGWSDLWIAGFEAGYKAALEREST